MPVKKHLYFLDNLRVGLITLVIAHHVAQPYGPTGGFWPIMEAARAPILGAFFTVNRSFFMSLFFMISGYLAVQSYDGHGPWPFLKSRLLRLGIPVLVWMLLMIPVTVFAFGGKPWPLEASHLWFLEHLLIFSAVYVLWRVIRDRRARRAEAAGPAAAEPELRPTPRAWAILLFALGLALASAVVRTWFPIDKWVYLLGFIKVAFADVPRDLSFFIIGIVAYRQQWIQRFPTRAGYGWLGVGVGLALVWTAGDLIGWDRFAISDFAWGLIYPTWESLLCCGMCIGLTVLFREKLNLKGKLGQTLAQSQYAAYIIHILPVLLVQLAILSLPLPPLAKFILATLISVPLVFFISNLVRKPLHL